MVMAVVEVNGVQSVTCTLGMGDGTVFVYLGSLNCNFEQFGLVNSWLKKIPETLLTYKNEKWTKYIQKIMQEIASL
jgi:hypothetical protein